jgi:hypothetical protein
VLVVLLDSLAVDPLLSCFRPGRLVMRYSQVVPRLEHREQIGFSLEHRTLDTAQA